MIEVNMCSGSHDHIMILFRCFDTASFTSPTHYCCVLCQAAFKYLIPSDHLLALAVYILFHPLYEITLQFVLVFKIVVLYSFLALWTSFPSAFGTFIPTNMYILRRKKRYYFIKHILK